MIKDYIASCEVCSKRKRSYGKKEPGKEQVIPVRLAFKTIENDYCGPYPTTSKGNKHIIVSIDYREKWVETKDTPNTYSTTTAKALFELIIK